MQNDLTTMATEDIGKSQKDTIEDGNEKVSENALQRACDKYLPVAGSISTLIFSVNVMNPGLLRSIVSPYEVLIADLIWLDAHVGTGLYIYSRRHLQKVPTPWRVAYSACGAVLFNFGTVLFWATSKALLPKSDIFRTLFGIASGIGFLTIAQRYLTFVDESVVAS